MVSARTAVMAALGIAVGRVLYATNAGAVDIGTTNTQSAESDQLETIVVTAQRRSENVDKVSISISTVSGAAVTEAEIANVEELGTSVPGLNIENNVGLNLSIVHVEVLKGPQGTLFGRIAVGAALLIVTKDPSKTPSAEIDVGYGNLHTTTATFDGTTPIGTKVATEVALYNSNQADDWSRNLTTNTQNFRARTIPVRNKWVYTPLDGTEITPSIDYALTPNQLGSQWSCISGSFGVDSVATNRSFYNSLGNGLSQNESQQYGPMLRIDQNFGWARGARISSVRASANHDFIDQDATPLPAVEGGPVPQNDGSYSEELQLLSPDNSAIKWIAGVYAPYDKYYTPGFHIDIGTTTHEVLMRICAA